jgi:CO/xanthine dehydrogenase Mo-binding subunit
MNENVRLQGIGAHVPLVDGPEKVSGRAKYTADLIEPDALVGRIYRSPYAHADILEVDTSQAERLPGVKAVLTGADCAQTFGVLPIARTEHPLARDKVRYKGEPVAAVAAVDAATAERAIRLIRMRVREMPSPCTPKSKAMSSGTSTSSWAALPPALPKPTWYARRPTTAPRCVRTKWKCTRRWPATIACVTA